MSSSTARVLNRGDPEDRDYLNDDLICAVNFPIVFFFLAMIFYVHKKVGLQYVKSPMNYYIVGYVFVFSERLVDAALQQWLFDRQNKLTDKT